MFLYGNTTSLGKGAPIVSTFVLLRFGWAAMGTQAHSYEAKSDESMIVFACHNLCKLPYDLNAFHGREKEVHDL